MNTVTLSPQFELVIPETVRTALHLKPGQKFRVLSYSNRIELIPVRTVQQMRGFLRGMDTTIDRETDCL